jgi:hypothetical protein
MRHTRQPAPEKTATRRRPDMTEDDAVRGLPTCPATYLLRDGIPVCTTCGAVIGAADADQIRHSTWHATLAALFAVADPHDPVDQGRATFRSAPIAAGERSPIEQD